MSRRNAEWHAIRSLPGVPGLRWELIKVVGALESEEMAHGSGSKSTADDENLTQFL
jgi:hypothetical protein